MVYFTDVKDILENKRITFSDSDNISEEEYFKIRKICSEWTFAKRWNTTKNVYSIIKKNWNMFWFARFYEFWKNKFEFWHFHIFEEFRYNWYWRELFNYVKNTKFQNWKEIYLWVNLIKNQDKFEMYKRRGFKEISEAERKELNNLWFSVNKGSVTMKYYWVFQKES